MENGKCFFAVDLGATSGRTIIGTLTDGKFSLEELTRFDNNLIQTGGRFYWDIYALYLEIIKGLKLAAQNNIPITSIGIDTWGVDFVFVGDDGAILRNPRAYRDPHTMGVMEEFFDKCMDKKKVYDITGIQFMNFNSLFQLYAMRRNEDSAMRQAAKVLFVPDCLSYMLTGKMVCEYTIASTSQILDPRTKELDDSLLKSVGLKREQFGEMVNPATVIGTLTEEVQALTGLGAVPVIAVAGHDTASAVAAVPACDEQFAYLSSGTWSLMGIEAPAPVINGESARLNFTNEGGIEGTTRFLKNITGMWLLEQCRKVWKAAGRDYSYPELVGMARTEAAYAGRINPDDPRFAHPDDMVAEILSALGSDASDAQVVSCIFHSLAERYKEVLDMLQGFAPFKIGKLHIIGGGSVNELLNQWTADAIGMPVVAGPTEATAIGNVMIQAKAAGLVRDRWEMRRLIAEAFSVKTFYPTQK